MSSIVTCNCGYRIQVPDSLAGRAVDCPECGAPVTVPLNDGTVATGNIRVKCPSCADMFQAKPSLVGKRLACPSCRQPLVVAPADDPRVDVSPGQAAAAPSRPSLVSAPRERASPPVVTQDSSEKPGPRKGASLGTILLITIAVLGIGGRVMRAVFRAPRNPPVQQQPPWQGPQLPGMNISGNRPYPFQAMELFPLSEVRVPTFPELGACRVVGNGVQVYSVELREADDFGPGGRMRMRVYLPPGDHPPQSLPCVLVAPAGTTLLTGIDLDGEDYHDETLPYAEAGMAVVFYSLDGPVSTEPTTQEMADAYQKFIDARAGIVNGRNALEFAMTRLPQVDPRQIYCAGHSSAGTLSLLLAEHEPRISACVAYAPATDVTDFLGSLMADPAGLFFPGLAMFAVQASPATHVEALKCPTLVFHARDDSNVPFASSQRFVDSATAHGIHVRFVAALSGDHYDAMIEQGIPAAVHWLEQRRQGPR